VTAVRAFAGLIALEHLSFLVLEMFLWTKPLGLRTFHQSLEKALTTRVLAANQGLYNGFLAAGIVWGLLAPPAQGPAILAFFLACVLVAGVFGGLTHSSRIFWIQGVPAALALGLLRAFAS
jgi:putative membrane protein